jgi:hypothetical protein
VWVVRTDVSEERAAFIPGWKESAMSEVLVTANDVPRLRILSTLKTG